MKQNLIIFFLFLINFTFSQQLFYKNHLVDSIQISAFNGGYSISKGKSKIKTEVLKIKYSNKKQLYIINKHFIIKKNGNNQIKRKLIIFKKKITFDKINLLLKSFENSQIPDNILQVVDSSFFYKRVTKSNIIKIARKYQAAYHFNSKFYSKDSINKIINTCQNYLEFRHFLYEKFDTISLSGFMLVADYVNNMVVEIYFDSTKYEFIGKYPNIVKQPWFDNSMPFDLLKEKTINNLMINYSLERILPETFLLRKTITIDALLEEYIKWYLKQVKILNKFD